MAGHLIAANKINTETAGQTNPAALDPNPGTYGTKAPVPSEILPGLIHGLSPLQSIVSGGSHPEALPPVPIHVGLTKATDSVKGKLGGLVPQGLLQPGPAGSTAAAERVQHLAMQTTTAAKTAGSRLRKALGL